MKKTFLIIFTNIILFAIIIFSLEIIVWGCENLRIKFQKEIQYNKLPIPFHPGIKRIESINLEEFKDSKKTWTRKPEGLNYTKKPIVIFGCSYAYGLNLNKEQTFSYKLSHFTKRPVYNRAVSGWGFQHMLNQVKQNQFYIDIPEPEYVIYLMINDHFRRLYVPTFMSASLLDETYNLRYELKDGKLIIKKEKNALLEFIHRLYITQKIEHFYINNILLKSDNYEQYFLFALQHLVESKNEMKKHWKNTKYVVILYQTFPHDNLFIEQLKKNGFIVISLKYDYNLNLHTPEYMSQDYHPKEQAWDLLTKKISESLNI